MVEKEEDRQRRQGRWLRFPSAVMGRRRDNCPISIDAVGRIFAASLSDFVASWADFIVVLILVFALVSVLVCVPTLRVAISLAFALNVPAALENFNV